MLSVGAGGWGGRWLAVAGLVLLLAVQAGAEVLYPQDASNDFFTWANDLKPGYIILEKNTNGRLCYCKKPSVLVFPDGLTTTTTTTGYPSLSSFAFSMAGLAGGSLDDADMSYPHVAAAAAQTIPTPPALPLGASGEKESSFEYILAQSGYGIQRQVNVSTNTAPGGTNKFAAGR